MWWVGRFFAQDVVADLGPSAAEYTTLPWTRTPIEVVPLDTPNEMVYTRRLLRAAAKEDWVQDLMRDVFNDLAADATARGLPSLRKVEDEWLDWFQPG